MRKTPKKLQKGLRKTVWVVMFLTRTLRAARRAIGGVMCNAGLDFTPETRTQLTLEETIPLNRQYF